MAEVFISYKRDQRERVELIADALRNEQFSVWFDANLEASRGEGFDAEIEREVTSAYCVLACWTPAATRSIYVRAEAKKGLERDALVLILLEQCALPVPFNAIDAVDLTHWHGDRGDPSWGRVLSQLKDKVARGKRTGGSWRTGSREVMRGASGIAAVRRQEPKRLATYEPC